MVRTRLVAIRSKKYILPTNHNLNNSNNVDSDNDASNIVIDNDSNIELIVPETQTQIVYATQLGSTDSVDNEDLSPVDCCGKAPELEKIPVLSTLTGEKSSHEASKITGTPPSKNKTGPKTLSFVPKMIEIAKYGYETPTKEPFKSPENLEVSPTWFTPTPELDSWFLCDEDQFHCLGLIQNLHEFPIKRSEEWLNKKFCQFKKIVYDNNLIRVKVLTNMWLDDGLQHSFRTTLFLFQHL